VTWWYMSFERCSDQENVGCAVVEAEKKSDAFRQAFRLIAHLNFFVEILVLRMPGIPEDKLPPPDHRNRLLTAEEMEKATGEPMVDVEARDGKLNILGDN
jgi:hypothetical protein